MATQQRAPAAAVFLLALLSSAPPAAAALADGVHAVRDGVLSGSGGDGDGSQTGYYGGKCRDCNAHSSVSIDGKVKQEGALDKAWDETNVEKKTRVKLGGGFYCGQIEVEGVKCARHKT